MVWRGTEKPAYVVLITEAPQAAFFQPAAAATCDVLLIAEAFIGVDDPIAFEATHPGGVTATVSEGGSYDENNQFAGPYSCVPCCQGDSEPPEEVTVGFEYPPGLIAYIQGTSHPGSTLEEAVEIAQDSYGCPPEGDYVLTLVPEIGTTSGTYLRWSGDGFLSITVRPCALHLRDDGNTRHQWEPREIDQFDFAGAIVDTVECNHCNKKCMTVIDWGSAGRDYGEGFCASRCVDTPQCGPAAGEYDFRVINSGFNGVGTVTIT